MANLIRKMFTKLYQIEPRFVKDTTKHFSVFLSVHTLQSLGEY